MKRGKYQEIFAERLPRKAASKSAAIVETGEFKQADARLSQADLAARSGLEHYTFMSQIENGSAALRHPGARAGERGLEQAAFARHLSLYHEPELIVRSV